MTVEKSKHTFLANPIFEEIGGRNRDQGVGYLSGDCLLGDCLGNKNK